MRAAYEEEVINALNDQWSLRVDKVDGILYNNQEVIPHLCHLLLKLLLLNLQLTVAHSNNLKTTKNRCNITIKYHSLATKSCKTKLK